MQLFCFNFSVKASAKLGEALFGRKETLLKLMGKCICQGNFDHFCAHTQHSPNGELTGQPPSTLPLRGNYPLKHIQLRSMEMSCSKGMSVPEHTPWGGLGGLSTKDAEEAPCGWVAFWLQVGDVFGISIAQSVRPPASPTPHCCLALLMSSPPLQPVTSWLSAS